jgi:hypothetical protein
MSTPRAVYIYLGDSERITQVTSEARQELMHTTHHYKEQEIALLWSPTQGRNVPVRI